MAGWLACAAGCADTTHWIVSNIGRVPEKQWKMIGGYWQFRLRTITSTESTHTSLTNAAAHAIADSVVHTLPPFGSAGTDTMREVYRIQGDEYGVRQVVTVWGAWGAWTQARYT